MKTSVNHKDFSFKEIKDNHDIYSKRVALYKTFGLDQEKMRRDLAALLSSGKSALEVGTGKGLLTVSLAEIFDKVVTVDIDDKEKRIAMLNVAYNNKSDVEFVTADASELPYADRSFDAVVSAFAFHHLEYPFKVIKEMIRLADKQIIISDFDNKGFNAVESIHKSEGRIHERAPGDFSIAGYYMKEFGFEVSVINCDCQVIYAGRRK